MSYYYSLIILTDNLVKTTIPVEEFHDGHIYHYKELNDSSRNAILDKLDFHLSSIVGSDNAANFIRNGIDYISSYLLDLDSSKWKDWPAGRKWYDSFYDDEGDLVKLGVEFKSTYVPNDDEWVVITP